jgi:hypothetical protein
MIRGTYASVAFMKKRNGMIKGREALIMRNLKKLLFLVALMVGVIVLLCSCSSTEISGNSKGTIDVAKGAITETNTPVTKTTGTANSNEKNSIDIQNKEIAKKLMAEYQDNIRKADKSVNAFVDAINKNDTKLSKDLYTDAMYDLRMTYSKYYGISGVYKSYFTNDDINSISKKLDSISNKISGGDIIHFGYSKNGIFFIVLAQPQSNVDFQSEDVINKIRNDENEANFFSDIGMSTKSGDGYYALDVYVEDLNSRNNNNEYTVDDIAISDEDGVTHASGKLQDSDLENILSKYKRNIEWNNTLINKGWKMFLFDTKGVRLPKIEIKYKGEDIILK